MNKNKINILRKKFKKYKIDGYIIPKNDDYFSEYATNDRLKKITKFSGSAGIAVILKKNNYLFVDGRYTIQAHQESSKDFSIIEIHKKLPHTIIKNYNLGYDPSLFTNYTLKKYFIHNKLISINQNLIDEISKFNEKKTKPFYSLEKNIVGETHQSKISKVINFLHSNKADYLFVSAPENVAWLLNIRGYDNPNSPIPNARLIIHKNKKIYLITKKTKAFNIIKEKKIKENQVINNKEFLTLVNRLSVGSFIIDHKTCSIFYENIIKKKFKILKVNDPIYKLKSIKNMYEIKHMIEAHKKDGLALTKFIYWIKNIKKNKKYKNIQKIQKFNKI